LEIIPNPLNEYTSISFSLSEPAYTEVSIYNLSGAKLVTLSNDYLIPGNYSFAWNGTDAQGNHLKPGVYHCLLRSGRAIQNIKFLKY
jgi:hypothetical protein